MVRPLVSVLLPVRNAAPTLPAALVSLRSQSFADFEVLVLDDGSTDASARLAASTGDPRIRVLADGQHRGLAARLNQGVQQARGEFIARMDADDVCLPHRLQVQLDFLAEHQDVDLVGCRAAAFREGGKVLGLLPFAETHETLCARPWHTIPLPHPTWFGRRAWFLRHPYRIPEVRRAEDQELLIRASLTSRFACVPTVLLAYRLGPPDLRKSLLARRSQLAAQVRLLAARGAWNQVALAGACAALKTGRDLVAAAARRSGYRVQRDETLLDSATREALVRALEG